jgi:hypothetical protein
MRSIVAAGMICGMLGTSTAVVAAPILDQSQTTGFGISPGGYPTTVYWQGQTVSPTQGILTSIDIAYGSEHSMNATIDVYGQTANNGFSLSTPLGSSTRSIGSTTGDWVMDWYSFNFNNVDIRQYTSAHGAGRLLFVVKSDSDPVPGENRFLYGGGGTTEDLYPGGMWQYSLTSGTSWSVVGGVGVTTDVAFRLYTEAVPEPASLGLMLIGCAGILMRRRGMAQRY